MRQRDSKTQLAPFFKRLSKLSDKPARISNSYKITGFQQKRGFRNKKPTNLNPPKNNEFVCPDQASPKKSTPKNRTKARLQNADQ
jgi:hypothetical protein